jgi:hypothetical protein
MSNVLLFPRARIEGSASGSSRMISTEQTAQILLFTGVRYERHSDEVPQNAGPDSSGGDEHHTPRRRRHRRRA